MSITIYTEPNYKGLSTTFDPNAVRMVYLSNRKYATKSENTFSFVNNNDNIKLKDKAESVPFKIGSVKNNSTHFFLLAIGNYLKIKEETPIINDAIEYTIVKPLGLFKYETRLIQGSSEDTLDITEYKELLIMKYPKCYYNEMIVCIIIIVLLIAFILFMKFTNGQ